MQERFVSRFNQFADGWHAQSGAQRKDGRGGFQEQRYSWLSNDVLSV